MKEYLIFICVIFLNKMVFPLSTTNVVSQDTVAINQSYQLGGTVYNDEGKTIKKGKALLYKKKDKTISDRNQKFIPLDTVNIHSEYSFYLFDNLPVGEYLVKIIPDIREYQSCIPRYYKNVFYDKATTIHLEANSIENDFYLHTPSYNIFSGSGIIHGDVTFNIITDLREDEQTINKEGIVILITNKDSREIVGYTLTDKNGCFQFDNVANGKYMLLAENTDWIFWPTSVEISDHASTVETKLVLFQVKEETIVNNIEVNQPKVYPNPSTDYITINSEVLETAINPYYTIFDIKGCKIKSQLIQTEVNSKRQINISDLKNGLYILRIQTDKNVVNVKFVKK